MGNQRADSDIDVAVDVNSIDSDFFFYAPLLWKLRHEVDDRIEPVLLVNGKDESGFLQGILQNGLVI
jgi:predicted nucleotidyltransferase